MSGRIQKKVDEVRTIRPALLSLLLVIIASFGLAAATGADQWVPPQSQVQDFSNYGVIVTDSHDYQISTLTSYSTTTVNGQANQNYCPGYSSSGPCQFDGTGVSWVDATVLLPVCTTQGQTNCVESMALGTDGGTLQASTFTGMSAGQGLAADASRGLPEGSTVGLWNNSVVNGGGTTTYATHVVLHFGFGGGHFTPKSLYAAIEPYSTISGDFQTPLAVQSDRSGQLMAGVAFQQFQCAWTSAGFCGRLQDFAPGTLASMTIRLSSEFGGWFKGRLKSPALSVEPIDSSSNRITVTAEPVEVPELVASVPVTTSESQVKTFFSFVTAALPVVLPTNGWLFPSADPRAFDAIDVFRPATSDTSSGLVSLWTFGSTPGVGPCLADTSRVLGLVTTNAMAYDDHAPVFENGQLNYHVDGMHFEPDGSLTLGTYDLVMRSDVARCLYHFSSAPVSASISVTNESGAENVATTTVNESNGWLHLGAYGFTFSAPTISVQLTQAAPPAPKAKKVTITCVSIRNKNRIRRISGVSPRCPISYRRR